MSIVAKGIGLLFVFGVSYFLTETLVYGAEAPNLEKLPCGAPEQMEKSLTQRGFQHLLDMKNTKGVNEQLWTGGQVMVITVEKDKELCMVSEASDVTFNPITMEKILNVWKKGQKDL